MCVCLLHSTQKVVDFVSYGESNISEKKTPVYWKYLKNYT